ncbi:MAG TPA: hypothetical protein VGG74_28575 [Kofleriaceae bacterium]|jgi:hypothetical protein
MKAAVLVLVPVLVAACGGAKPPAAAERIGPALEAAFAAADHVRAPWRCAAADLPSPDVPPWHARGRDGLVIGVVADAGGAAPKTLAALGRLRDKILAAHADAIVALGGMGSNEHDLEATLGALAAKSTPLIAVPGDLESMTAEVAAIAALRARGATVVDGRLTRRLDASGATLETVPGASAPIDAEDGCAWTPADVTRIYDDLAAGSGVRVALVAGAPREEHAGEVSGELALVPEAAVDVVIHGPAWPEPSPGRSGGRDGGRVTLSPGTSDASPRLPEMHAPAAGVLAIRGSAWTWTPLVDR